DAPAAPESTGEIEPDPDISAPEFHDDSPSTEEISPISEPEPATSNNQPTTTFSPSAFFSALLKQLYLDQGYVPRSILVPVDFPDRALLADLLTKQGGHRVEIAVPQRGEKRS